MPEVTPLTTPEAEIVAIAVLPLLHTPPDAELLRVAVLPAHNVPGPEITPAAGNGLTVTIDVAIHPVGSI